MRRRKTNPLPMSTMPMAIAAVVSNPVNGRVRAVDDEVPVAAVPDAELELTVPVDPVEPVDDEVPELLDPDELDPDEPEPDEPLELLPVLPLLPPSGSTYC